MRDLAVGFPGAVLILTGGEPLMRSDTLELAAEGTRLGLSMALSVDVGWLLTPETCAAIREAGVKRVSFSIHFPDAQRSDLFAGAPGFFGAALGGLANLRAAGVPFQLHTSVMRSTAPGLPALYRLAERIGAAAWELFFLVPTGRASLLAGEELPAGEQESVLGWLYALQRTAPFPVKQICAPHFRRVEVQRAKERGERRSPRLTKRLSVLSRGCLAGNGFCFVSHVGDVCGCGFLPLAVGNVRDWSFTELYGEAPLFRALRDPRRLGGACGGCEFRIVCGGCRARAYATTGDPLAEEPDCVWTPGGLRALPHAPSPRLLPRALKLAARPTSGRRQP
jgi:radical SAM protein with 4Fe4S-binding SPASM domain